MSALYRIVGYWLMSLWAMPLFAQQEQIALVHESHHNFAKETAFVEGQIIFKIQSVYRPFCQDEALSLPGFQEWISALQPLSLKKNFPFSSFANKNISGQPYDLDLIYELRFDADWPMQKVIRHLESHFAVAYAEPRYIYDFFYQPNDPLADTTGGIANQWYLAQVRAPEAWNLNKGDTSVVIGITDSGISFLHPDLKKNLAVNHGDPLDGRDNDQDGYIDNFRGWDFAGRSGDGFGDNDPSFQSKHGVSVTGIACATPDNKIGSAGTAFNCRYLPIKASPDSYPNSITHGYESVLYAAEQGAKVVNCSWGGRVNSKMGKDVVDYAIEIKKVAVVAACGNAPADLRFYPAAFDKVLSVTNLQFGDTVCCPEGLGLGTTYNYTVDVGAPGWKLSGPTGNSTYEGFSGTSAASPLASAVVAITCAHFPDYTGFQAAERVRVTTDPHYHITFNQNFLHKLGTGRVNMYRALKDPRKPSIRNLSYQLLNQNGAPTYLPGDTLYLRGEFVNYLDASSPELRLSIELPNSSQNAFVEWLLPEKVQGVVNMNEKFEVEKNPFAFRILPQAPKNLQLELRLVYTDTALMYNDFEYIEVIVNPTLVNIDINRLHTSMNSTGNFGYEDYPKNDIGLGVQYYGNERSSLFEGGFLIGKGPSQLSANLRDHTGRKQQDFVSLQNAVILENPLLAELEAESIFNDAGSPNPLGVTIVQHAYAWTDVDHEHYVIFDYVIQNDGAAPLTDLYAGMYANWDISDSLRNATYFSSGFQTVYALDLQRQDPAYYGLSLLTPGNITAYAAEVDSAGFSDAGYFTAISNVNSGKTTAGTSGPGANIWHTIGHGPFDLPPNSSKRIGFAVIAANGVNNLFIQRNLAALNYKCYVLQEGPVGGFNFSPDTAGINQTVTFSDLNTTSISWLWDFGDGTSSTLKNPSHTYHQVGNYTVSMTASDGACEVKKTQQIRIDYRTSGMETKVPQAFRLFPNPNKGNFSLQTSSSSAKIIDLQLHDLTGKIIWEKTQIHIPAGETVPIQIKELTAGIYLLKVISDQRVESLKMICK